MVEPTMKECISKQNWIQNFLILICAHKSHIKQYKNNYKLIFERAKQDFINYH